MSSEENRSGYIARGSEIMSRQLTGGWWRGLLIASAMVVLAGMVLAILSSDSLWLSRSGALLTALSIAHAAVAVRYSKLRSRNEQVVTDVWTEIERGRQIVKDEQAARARASSKVGELVPEIFDAVARRFAFQNLTMAAFGTFVWGFGDLLSFEWMRTILGLG